MSVNKRKREKVSMKTNDGERLVRKPEKHIRHLVLTARDLPSHHAFDLALETGSSVGNATSLALLRHSLAFTSIRRAGQRTSGLPLSKRTPLPLGQRGGLAKEARYWVSYKQAIYPERCSRKLYAFLPQRNAVCCDMFVRSCSFH